MGRHSNGKQSKVYIGQRPADDAIGDCRVVVLENGKEKPLHHVKHHSDAFEWGYGGSGPADLALSILADHLGERPTEKQLREGRCLCWQFHQRFKWHFIVRADQASFTLTSRQIDNWLKSAL